MLKENQSKRERNKAQKKSALVQAAEKLFAANGFENTSIDDVAKEAGVTKRTLYQYFTSKEDLFFAVALRGARQLTIDSVEALGQGDSAIDKIRNTNSAHMRFYLNHPDMFRLLNYQPPNHVNIQNSPHYAEMAELNLNRLRLFAELIELGVADKSINPELDTQKAIFFAVYTAFSLLYTVASTDTSAWAAMGFQKEDFLQFCFDLLANAIKAK